MYNQWRGVLGNDYRHPVLVHRMAATLDVLSGGRLTLGFGAGWLTADHEAAGIPLDRAGVRIDRLVEAVAVIKGLFGAEPLHHDGAHYQAYAGELATWSSPPSMAAIRHQVYADLSRDSDDAMAKTLAIMERFSGRPDAAEGVASFVERRRPASTPSRPTSTPRIPIALVPADQLRAVAAASAARRVRSSLTTRRRSLPVSL